MTYSRIAVLGVIIALIIVLGMIDLAAYVITGLPILAVW